jgi:hypothetical protein
MLCILCYEKLIIDLFNEKQKSPNEVYGKAKKIHLFLVGGSESISWGR